MWLWTSFVDPSLVAALPAHALNSEKPDQLFALKKQKELEWPGYLKPSTGNHVRCQVLKMCATSPLVSICVTLIALLQNTLVLCILSFKINTELL